MKSLAGFGKRAPVTRAPMSEAFEVKPLEPYRVSGSLWWMPYGNGKFPIVAGDRPDTPDDGRQAHRAADNLQ
ncbi:MAG: hypothetical protein ACE5JP_14265 [Candidatus Bipolaricaulia bacterium]